LVSVAAILAAVPQVGKTRAAMRFSYPDTPRTGSKARRIVIGSSH
jgi:hypothetical protein